MKKQLLISCLILFLAHNFIYAIEIDENYLSPLDDSTETIGKSRKNVIEIELFGKGDEMLIGYQRTIFEKKRSILNLGIGFSPSTFFLSDFQCFMFSFPFSIEYKHYFIKTKVFFQGFSGVSLLYQPNGNKLSKEEVLLDDQNNLIVRVGCQYVPSFATNLFLGGGLGYDINENWSVKLNYYRMGVFSTNTLDNKIWVNRLGLNVTYKFY